MSEQGTHWRELVVGRRGTAGRQTVAVVAGFTVAWVALVAANTPLASRISHSGTAYWLATMLTTVGGAAANGYLHGGLLASSAFASAGVYPFLLLLMLDGGTADYGLIAGVVEASKYALPYGLTVGGLAFAVGRSVRGRKL